MGLFGLILLDDSVFPVPEIYVLPQVEREFSATILLSTLSISCSLVSPSGAPILLMLVRLMLS